MSNASTQYNEQFIDFSAGNAEFNDLASIQQEGSIALYNILNQDTDSLAYLADEVGMGKTFIALGTVMLMRYLNPSLRVLYIAPNRQLKDQWIEEYQRFIKNHVKLSHGHIRSFSGSSAVPYADCNSLNDLIQNTTDGYFADYFVQMNSFSFAMDTQKEDDIDFFVKKLKLLKEKIPAYTESILSDHKKIESNEEVKQHYALALNYVLPKFDLIVVDEAHKFKNGIRSSTRNQMLALVLGTSDKGIGKTILSDQQKTIQKKLTSKTLLLSATPFDRNLEHIRNQIELFSGEELAQKYFPMNDKGNIELSIKDKQKLIEILRKFLVRRLNNVQIGKDNATRNMYRHEHRDNAIELKGFQNKLVMALVQKHVGDLVEDKQTASPSFQMGLLASFESFADSAGAKVFDGDEKISEGKDQAKDASLIQKLNDSYKEAGLGSIMPHPKMDEVVNNHSGTIFANGEKHLFFVRRVKSVSELVQKWNSQYNEWLIKYLNDNSEFSWNDLYEEYKQISPNQKYIKNNNSSDEDSDIESEDLKTDTFFSWFYKGKHLGEATSIDIPYKDFKIKMTKKEDPFALYFELNWVLYLISKYDLKVDINSSIFKNSYLSYVKTYKVKEKEKTNYFNRYHAAQYAALNCLGHNEAKIVLKKIYGEVQMHDSVDLNDFNEEVVNSDLNTRSIFNELEIIDEKKCVETFILKELILTQFRQDHLMIDLYLSILTSKSMNEFFIDKFMYLYKKQAEINSDLTTYSIIKNVKENISLICETSLQRYSRDIGELVYKGLINSYNRNKHRINLSPLDPVVGVSGDTGNKSEPARKFRLPGYPIVMVATDVMQEGVNLHTFCRSITHYGLSGTPIHIEQKNGRVDRINSLTHRKIQNNKYESLENFHDEKIQVRFPFVRQSYESFQVRRLSHSLNEYLESLHDIEIDNFSDDKLYVNEELSSALPIPEAYTKFLETPFEIMEVQKYIPENLFQVIELKTNEISKLLKLLSIHIENLFDEAKEMVYSKLQHGEKILLRLLNYGSFYIQLKPAKSNGEFLLEFTRDTEENNLIELLVGSDTYMQSNEELTHKEEILGAAERLFEKIYLDTKKELNLSEMKDIKEYWKKDRNIPFAGSKNISFEFINNSVVFKIGEQRRHKIDLYSIEVCKRKYVLFYTKVTQNTTDKDNIEKAVDIVKFVDDGKYIIGYTLHDFNHMQPKEFMYNAYVLAIEADLYEYQLSIQDQF